jgi:hypothetical protein
LSIDSTPIPLDTGATTKELLVRSCDLRLVLKATGFKEPDNSRPQRACAQINRVRVLSAGAKAQALSLIPVVDE